MEFLGVALSTVIPFLVVLTVVVFVHELGHFLVARFHGVRVETFSIGFGWELFGFNDRCGTRWKFSMIPLGGYVKFFGEGVHPTQGGSASHDERSYAFPWKSVRQRAAIVFAGPAANFLFAFVVLVGLFMVVGRPITPPVIGSVLDGSPAAAAGLRPGERFISIDGVMVGDFADVQRIVQRYGGRNIPLVVERDGVRRNIIVRPQSMLDDGAGRRPAIGVTVNASVVEWREVGVLDAPIVAGEQVWHLASGMLVALGQMVSGTRGLQDLGGPLLIAEYSKQAARHGVVNVVMLIALLSVNLGLINLLPIPMLDGGHLAMYAWEAIIGRPLGERVQELGLRVGLALLVGLMVLSTWNDVVRLLR